MTKPGTLALLLTALGCGGKHSADAAPATGGSPSDAGVAGESGDGAAGGAGSGGGGAAGSSGTAGSSGGSAEPDCGNGLVEDGEDCDDRDATPGEGCSESCAVEPGWTCSGSPSVCNRSCAGMRGDECHGNDCCESPLVPGGTFTQGRSSTFTSTVSSYRLDRYEVTVGRFNAFVRGHEAWRAAGNPVEGAGANPAIPGSGWQGAWDDIPDARVCAQYGEYSTWAEAGRELFPMNCVTWATAFAFCIWDGGRLPTESEWEFAAAGGASDTLYPWGDTPVPTGLPDATADYAVYAGLGDGVPGSMTSVGDVVPVGTKPAGRGPFGQEDLAGSLWEMTLDVFEQNVFIGTATNYANLDESSGNERVAKGGSWESSAEGITATSRYGFSGGFGNDISRGFRCARNP